MEPLSLILLALATGAAKAAENVAPDAYNGLKALIKKKFAGKPKAEMVLEEHEQDPETYEAPLKKKLAEAGADKDEEIIKAAQKLVDQLESQPGGKQVIQNVKARFAAVAGIGNASIGNINDDGKSEDNSESMV